MACIRDELAELGAQQMSAVSPLQSSSVVAVPKVVVHGISNSVINLVAVDFAFGAFVA